MRFTVFLWLILLNKVLYSQEYDKTWVCGRYASTVVFNANQIDTASFSPAINVAWQWACISDREGNFQFFTEGVNVYSNDGTAMVNGDNLADNSINANYPNGLSSWQNIMILPKGKDKYYIIYQSQSDISFSTQPWFFTDHLYYSVADMSLQNGKGEVIEKRTLLNSGSFMDGHMTACQHANGRDWWIVQRGYNSNRYLIYLATRDSISLVRNQQIGAISQEPDAAGQSAFSPDGTKYASITGKSPLIILDFDRCEGLFSDAQEVDIPIDTFIFYGQQIVSGGGGNGLCFSPNNRLLYVNTIDVLRQYDLFASPIDSSESIIFFWTDSNEYLGQFNQEHLAPNGKIYLANYQGFTSALHVINYPDSVGSLCGFSKWGLPIASANANKISNMVHFRMGPLIGSACDTILSSPKSFSGKHYSVLVYPNPAKNFIEIDLVNYTQYHVSQKFSLVNTTGELVKETSLPYLKATVDVGDLPNGNYSWRITSKNLLVDEGKIQIVK
jgi:hypothetical protein